MNHRGKHPAAYACSERSIEANSRNNIQSNKLKVNGGKVFFHEGDVVETEHFFIQI